MVSFHPLQEEANLLYYRTVPPKFEYMGEGVGLIKKPSMDFFITTTAPPSSTSTSNNSNHFENMETLTTINMNNDKSSSSNENSTVHNTSSVPCPHHLQPLSTVRRTGAGSLLTKSPNTSTSPLAISKKKKKAQAESVKSFVFSHHRSSSGASGSYDSAIRNILH